MKETLDLSQSSQMVQRLSPRQVQFARLLEMNALEFEEEVHRQIDDNPALEVVDGEYGAEASESARVDDSADASADFDPNDDPIDRYPRSSESSPSEWQIADDGPDLAAYLSDQVNELRLPHPIDKIALYIVGNLDSNGYLTRSLAAMADDLAINAGIDVSAEQMQQAFAEVRKLDPAGVGAIDLRDCILLQLKRIAPTSLPLRIAIEIVSDYFDLLSKKHYERLQSLMGLSGQQQLREAIDLIRSLNPKPGSTLSASSMAQRLSQITPDVAVEVANGRVSVSVASSIPQLQIEKSFSVDSEAKPKSRAQKEAQAFIKLKHDDAEAFISAIKLRNNTLVAVTEAIARRQIDFFKTGDKSTIRPMVLRDIASDTGLDMSVISRATAGKYVSTPVGIYHLKIFFNEASASEPDTSAHRLMHMIQQIIQAEDPAHPLSDRAIQDALEAKGIAMARRTVTKYREKLGLPVGRLRKKL